MNQAEIDLLVLTAQQGSKKAFGYLFKHFHQPLIGFAFKLCNNRELANDAVQDAWIKVSKNIRQLNDGVINENSAQQIFTEIESEKDETLSMAINSLPAIEKQIIHLFYLQELKISEISIALELATGTIKSRLNRARKMLKQKYENLEN